MNNLKYCDTCGDIVSLTDGGYCTSCGKHADNMPPKPNNDLDNKQTSEEKIKGGKFKVQEQKYMEFNGNMFPEGTTAPQYIICNNEYRFSSTGLSEAQARLICEQLNQKV